MPKMRGFKPETWTDEKIVSVSPLARLLFLGMWNYACDNGHVDDSPVQLKMRILPADNCDAAELVDELVNAGLVVRKDGYLKVPNLPKHQNIDRRFLTTCDHCVHDGHSTFTEADRIARTRRDQGKRSDPSGTRRAPVVHTPGAHGEVKGSEGEGEVTTAVKELVGSSPNATREEEHRAEDEPRSKPIGIKAAILSREYCDRVKLSDRAKVAGVVMAALEGDYDDQAIKRGLRLLAKESRPVTPDTLRIAIDGKTTTKTAGGYIAPHDGMRGREW